MKFNRNVSKSSLKSSTAKNTPKTSLNKTKLQPFGTNYVTKLSSVNSKLVCSLSAMAGCDVITDGQYEN
jgi:hypothetical protein